MALLNMSECYDMARDTNWTPRYVLEEELFPPAMSDPYGIPVSEWETFDEPYKVCYRDYVGTQREKDHGVYSVKAALSRSNFFRNASPHWRSLLELHFGVICFPEFH